MTLKNRENTPDDVNNKKENYLNLNLRQGASQRKNEMSKCKWYILICLSVTSVRDAEFVCP